MESEKKQKEARSDVLKRLRCKNCGSRNTYTLATCVKICRKCGFRDESDYQDYERPIL